MGRVLQGVPFGALVLGGALALGCGAFTPAPAPPFNTAVNVKELMVWIVDPSVDVIWDSVGTIYTEAGTKELAPRTDEQWDAVRNSAAIVAESGNLLLMDGRARDRGPWMSFASALTDAANGARKAAEARNIDALFAAGEDLYRVCSACHLRYASVP
jgi:hypothetical protein